MQYEWRTGRHSVFKNFVHLVFTTKYRRGVFTKEMILLLQKTFHDTCQQLEGELLEFGGEHDHVHLMVSVPPKKAISNFVSKLKGKSSYMIRKAFSNEIKKKLWGKHLWSPSYCVVSCGGASLDVVRQYINNQRTPPSANSIRQSQQEKGRCGANSRVVKGKISGLA